MKRFGKTKDCPSSEQLLAFQRGEIGPATSIGIRDHLHSCEFCGTEVKFYAVYPPADETPGPENIPQPLFELAEALLKKKRGMGQLYKLAGTE
jgi:hypothetical protein